MIVREESPGRIVVGSPAKLNLFLEVLGRRDDGYHEIETVFQEIDRCDEIEIVRGEGAAGEALEFACDVPELAPPGRNLVERAARAFFDATAIREPVRIRLRKTIPAGSGLGGGSSNAAATLLALDRLLGTRLPIAALETLAASLGSDCPFFLHGGSAIGRGRGERVEPLRDFPPRAFLVVVPPIAVSTASIYEALASSLKRSIDVRRIPLVELRSANLSLVGSSLHNRLETVAFARHPDLRRAADAMQTVVTGPVRLTGSGGALFAVFESGREASDASEKLRVAPAGAPGMFFIAASIPRRP